MSEDIGHLAAHLPESSRAAVQTEYDHSAKSPTTAFLLCFFLGIFGAHRFYLGQVGSGVVRLVLSPLVVPGIIWEIIDLFRIDSEVAARNRTLAERLIGAAALAVPSVGVAAAMERIAQANAQRSQATPAAAGAVSETPIYEATAVTPISGIPRTQARPVVEVHETDAPPVWPVAPGMAEPAPEEDASQAAIATASASEPTVAPIEHDAAAPGNAPTEMDGPSVIDFGAETAPGLAPVVPIVGALGEPVNVSRNIDPTDRGVDVGQRAAIADVGESTGERITVQFPEDRPDAAEAALPTALDWTEMTAWQPDHFDPAAPTEAPASMDMSGADTLSYADAMAQPIGGDETAPLVLIPQASADDVPPSSAELPAWGSAAVLGAAGLGALGLAEHEAHRDQIEQAEYAAPMEPPMPVAPAPPVFPVVARDPYESEISEELHDRMTDTGSHRIVKRVKVVRRLVVNGQVVEEATAEQVVDSDADTAATAATLQEALRGRDAQQRIAALSTPIPPAAADEPPSLTPSQPDTPPVSGDR